MAKVQNDRHSNFLITTQSLRGEEKGEGEELSGKAETPLTLALSHKRGE
jgi:hypothetical protein